ncbi:MAG: hypothetical protein KDK30_12275 [Leptospiraceae bacterium]|nr:hypothetical protein [Leptospiraceae bacterium]MCB1316967.1 hypothetical protein [Leptospiraceae bacterium]
MKRLIAILVIGVLLLSSTLQCSLFESESAGPDDETLLVLYLVALGIVFRNPGTSDGCPEGTDQEGGCAGGVSGGD